MLENTITSSQFEPNRLPKWPVVPWAMLVGLILWLLFGTMSCGTEPTLITQTQSVSRVASADYGTFSKLEFEAPGAFLSADTMTDGRVSILYYAIPMGGEKLIEPIVFDPAADTFVSRHAPIAFKKDREQVTISQTLFINDSTVIIIWDGSMEKLSSNTWLYGRIINLDSGEVIDIEGAEQIGEIRVLLELNDQKFAIAGIKGRPQKELLNTDPDYGKIPTGVIKTFDLTGKEIESKDVAGIDSYAIPTTTATNIYDRGDDILIFGDRLTIFDKTKLTFTSISNTIEAATVKRLPNGLLLAYPEPFQLASTSTGTGYSSDKVYLVNPENLQSIPIRLADALPIREQLLTAVTEFTSEKLTAALAPLKLEYRVSILNDGTILFAADNLYELGVYHWLVDLSGYKMLQPANQIARTRLSASRRQWGRDFNSDITLADGRVLYLGAEHVLYTPADEQTAEQAKIAQNKAKLPDWPGTDFKTQGVWSAAGYSTIVNENKVADKTVFDSSNGLQPLPSLLGIFTSGNSAEFFWGPRDVGDILSALVESWKYGSDKTTNLLREPTKVETETKQTYPIHDKYTAMLVEQKQERFIVKTSGKTYRISGREIERWNTKTKQWVSIYQENYDRLKTKAEKQGKSFVVIDDFTDQFTCNNIPPEAGGSGYDKEYCEAERVKQQAKLDKSVAEGKLVVMKREEVGGTLVGSFASTSPNQSVTVLPDGKILIVGIAINLDPADSVEGQKCIFPIDDPDKGRYTYHCALATSFSLLPNLPSMTSGGVKGLNLISNRGIELYDPKTGKSKFIGQLTLGRGNHQAIVLPDNKVAIIGGDTERVVIKDETISERVKLESYGGGSGMLAPSYEIIDLKTGESKLYENVLMFRHDTNDFQAFVMPDGHIYIGDSGVYSGAEVLDWQNGISYPTGQPTLHGLGTDYTTARLENGELVSVGADEDEIRGPSNIILGRILDTSVIETYRPVSSGRQLPIAQSVIREAITNSYAWLWFLYLQLAQLLLGLPLAYILALARRDRQKFTVPL